MLREHQKRFLISLQLFEIFALVSSWIGAYYLRFHVLLGLFPTEDVDFLQEFLFLSPLIGAITIYFNHRNKLYNSHRFNSWTKEIVSISVSNFQGIIAFILITYMFRPNRLPLLALGLYFVLSSLLLLTIRIIARNSLIGLRRKGRNLRHIYLVGSGEQLIPYIERVNSLPDSGLRLAGWYDSEGLAESLGIKEPEKSIQELLTEKKIDAIVVGYDDANANKIEGLVTKLYNQVIPVIVVPKVTYSFIGSKIEDFEGIPLLKLNHPQIGILGMAFKRLFDIIVSLLALIFFGPLMLMIALLVKLTSKGPVLYKQERMTRDGKSFLMWKFRSMRTDAEANGRAQWAVKNDPRTTKLGAFLRKTSLDELPQFFNVLTGHMSLVGPRPERPELIEKFKDEIPAYMLRHKMKAGITGWAQANGWRGNTSLEKRIEFDIYYIKNWSFGLDIKILFLTVIKGFINKNAY
jgi:Undecaprenyl-phosphate glucose phosphotransferase